MSKRRSSEEWSDDDIDESGLSVGSVDNGSPHKKRKIIESSDSGNNFISRTISKSIKSLSQSFKDFAQGVKKSFTRDPVDRQMNCQSLASGGSLGMNQTNSQTLGLSPENHRNNCQTVNYVIADQIVTIRSPARSSQAIVSTQMPHIIHLMPVTTSPMTTTNASPAARPIVVQQYGTSIVPYVPQEVEDMDGFKCDHCGQISTSPITRCPHCRQNASQSNASQFSSPMAVLSNNPSVSGVKRLTPSKFYRHQDLEPTQGRARMHMGSALNAASPVISNSRPVPLSYSLMQITQHQKPNTANRRTKNPELIELDGETPHESPEEIATQTTDDGIEIMDTNGENRSNDSNNNSNESSNSKPVSDGIIQCPIQTIPEYAMFGTYKAMPKTVEYNTDSIKLTNVSPNNKETKFKYHIMIPYIEIQQLLYCPGTTNPMILIKPTIESCGKIQDCMYLGENSQNGLKLSIKSKDSREHYIIIVYKEKLSERFANSLNRSSKATNDSIDFKAIDSERALMILTSCQTRVKSKDNDVALSRAQQLNRNVFTTPPSGRNSHSLTRRSQCSDSSSSSPSPRKSILNRTPIQTITIEIDDDEDDEAIIETNGESDTEFTKTILIYPKDAKDAIHMIGNDVKCLNKGEFLNDNIVNFYLRYLYIEKFEEDVRKRVHIFDTLFFMQLTEKRSNKRKSSLSRSEDYSFEQRYNQKLKKWTKNLNIFEKDFLIFPIIKESHWFLAIVCYPKIVYHLQKKLDKDLPELESDSDKKVEVESGRKPCVLFMDSLGNASHKKSLSQPIRDFLSLEWKSTHGFELSFRNKPLNLGRPVMRDFTPHVPNQNNSSDCGLFVLEYVEQFVIEPDDLVKKITEDPKTSSIGIVDWFDPKSVKNKRQEIRNLILEMVSPEVKERLETLIDDSKLSDTEDNDYEPMDDLDDDPTFTVKVPDEPKDELDRELMDEIGAEALGDSHDESVVGNTSQEIL